MKTIKLSISGIILIIIMLIACKDKDLLPWCEINNTGNVKIINNTDFDVTISLASTSAILVTSHPLRRYQAVNYPVTPGPVLIYVRMKDGTWHQDIIKIVQCRTWKYIIFNELIN
jgi:hypothetical protein